jgi:hypothetical protein
MALIQDLQRELGETPASQVRRKKEEKKKKPSGISGLIASLLPTGGGIGGAIAGGAAGAAAGSVVPVIGTGIGGLLGAIAGGAGGSAAGKFGQNAINQEEDLGKGVAQEAILGGLTSTPITAGGKLIKGAVQQGIGRQGALKQAAKEAGGLSIPRSAKGLREKAALDISQDITAKAPKTGILSRMQNKAARTDANVSGLGVGKSLKGETITPKRSTELYDFARSKGVSSGSPTQQAEAAQRLFDDTTTSLSTSLNAINRKLEPLESKVITDSLTKSISKAKGVGKELNTDTKKFISQIKSAKDIKTLEKLRQEADDLAFTARGAGKTQAAKQAQEVRKSIDGFVTKLSGDYKAVKSDYQNAKDLLKLSSQNVASGKGGLDIFGNKVGTNVIPGAISKGSGLLARASKDAASKAADDVQAGLSLAGQDMSRGQGLLGTVARQSLLGSRPELAQEEVISDETGLDELALDDQLAADQFGQDTQMDEMAQIQENLKSAALEALANGDTKGLDNIMAVADLYSKFNPKSSSPALTTSQATRAAAAQNALNDVPMIEDAIKSGKLGAAKAIPGASTQLGRRILGTEDLDAALFNMADNILRARSGAAAPEAEVKRFVDTFLPGALDSEEAKKHKLDRAIREMYGYVNPTAASQGADINEIIAGM